MQWMQNTTRRRPTFRPRQQIYISVAKTKQEKWREVFKIIYGIDFDRLHHLSLYSFVVNVNQLQFTKVYFCGQTENLLKRAGLPTFGPPKSSVMWRPRKHFIHSGLEINYTGHTAIIGPMQGSTENTLWPHTCTAVLIYNNRYFHVDWILDVLC